VGSSVPGAASEHPRGRLIGAVPARMLVTSPASDTRNNLK